MRPGLLALLVPAVALATLAATPPNLRQTIEQQRDLVAASPSDDGAWNDLGNLLVVSRDLRGAEEAFRRAIALAPEKPTAHFNLGMLQLRRGKELSAWHQLRKVLDLDPENAWAIYACGRLLDGWGLDALAEREYARALALDPRLADYRYNSHLIDNELATRAMLRAAERRSGALDAPAEYDDPSRLARILSGNDLPEKGPAPAAASTPPPPAPEKGAATSGGAARTIPQSAARPAQGRGEAVDEKEGGYLEVKVLDSGDLEPGKGTGQVQGGKPSGSPRGRGAASQEVTPGYPARFVPVPTSTGQLEVEVHPVAS